MEKVINLTGRSYTTWSEKQFEEVSKYGEIIDIPYPRIETNMTNNDKQKVVKDYLDKIKDTDPAMILCAGEMITTYNFVTEFEKMGIPVYNATTERNVIENKVTDKEGKEITEKKVVFNFVGLRSYFDEKGLYNTPEEIKKVWNSTKEEREAENEEKGPVFLTISNHDVNKSWSSEQIKAANDIGYIEQIKFPNINPELNREDMKQLLTETLEQIVKINPSVVHVQGETVFTANLVNSLRELEIPVVSAVSNPVKVGDKNIFVFERWDTYDLTDKDRKEIEKIIEDQSKGPGPNKDR